MKKLTIAFALVLCLVLCVFCFASCGKKGTIDATTETPGTAPSTTATPTQPEATQPEATEPEATQPDATEPEHVHTWDTEYTEDVPATCSTPGSKSIHCLTCDQIQPNSSVEIPADDTLHNVETWTVTKEATLFEDGSRHGECTYCHRDIEETIATSYGLALSSESGNGATDIFVKRVLYPDVREGNHFYPTEDNPEGNDLLVEFSLLWNESFVNNTAGRTFYVSKVEKATQRNAFQFDYRANMDGQDCKFAGGFEPNGKRNVISGDYTLSGEDWPTIGEYGWHRIATRIHQDQTWTGSKVQYVMTATLYIDGAEICKYDTIHDRWTEKPLYNATTDDEGATWTYTDNDDETARISAFYIDGFYNNTAGSIIYLVYGDVYVTCGQDFVQDVRPVADPEEKTMTVAEDVTFPASFYYALRHSGDHVWDGEFTETEAATLLSDGVKVEHCTLCGEEHEVEFAYVPPVAVSSDAVATEYGNNDYFFAGKKTYADVREENHFYPTEENLEGNDLLVEFSLLWNETIANNTAGGVFYVSKVEKNTQRNAFQFDYRANMDGQDCKFAGGFEPNGKRNVLSGEYTFSGEDFPTIGEYGWHRIATRIHQDQTWTGSKVQYVMTATLYIDGVEICKYDTIHDRWTEKPLYNATTDDEGATWTYTDNDDENARIYAMYIDHFYNNVAGSTIYLVFGDVYVTCGQDFAQDVEPVATPAAADPMTVAEGVDLPMEFYYQLKAD